MKLSSRIIWKADKKLNERGNIGYLYLSTRVGGKQILKGINLPPVEKRYWLKSKSRVSDSFPKTVGIDADKINSHIEIKLREASLSHHDFRYLPDEKKSFTDYWRQQIDLTTNIGTKQKYENVRKLLLEFINHEYSAVDVKFKDINADFIKSFFNWLRMVKNNTKNTTNFKLKCFQGMLNRAINDNVYYYSKTPFATFDYQFEDTMVNLLSIKELDRLFNTQFFEVVRSKQKFGYKLSEKSLSDSRYKHEFSLDDYRNFWLFQLFAQGMRVSDLLTLRWNDFKQDENKKEDIRIIKRMVKTKAQVTIYLNDKLIDILTPYVLKFCTDQKTTLWYKKLIEINNEILQINQEELMGIFALNYNHKLKIKKKQYEKNQNKEKIQYLENLTSKRRNIIKQIIVNLSVNEKTSFVFKILKDSDFADIDEKNDFGKMSKFQYTRMTGARSYYNRLLKCVAKQSKIEKNLTSHLARHSYTSLMIELGEEINLFDVMSSLGHKHINTTQKYYQKFTNKKLDKVSQVLSNKLESKWKLNDDFSAYNPINKPLKD